MSAKAFIVEHSGVCSGTEWGWGNRDRHERKVHCRQFPIAPGTFYLQDTEIT